MHGGASGMSHPTIRGPVRADRPARATDRLTGNTKVTVTIRCPSAPAGSCPEAGAR